MSDKQYEKALVKANRIRLARAEVKRGLVSGKLSIGEVVLNPKEETENWDLFSALICQRRWGRTRARRFLTSMRISEQRTIGTLTERQRGLIAGFMAGSTARSTAGSTSAERSDDTTLDAVLP